MLLEEFLEIILKNLVTFLDRIPEETSKEILEQSAGGNPDEIHGTIPAVTCNGNQRRTPRGILRRNSWRDIEENFCENTRKKLLKKFRKVFIQRKAERVLQSATDKEH